MATDLAHVQEEALRLSQEDRLHLARVLLEAAEEADPDADAAWDAEIARRIKAVDGGTARGRPEFWLDRM